MPLHLEMRHSSGGVRPSGAPAKSEADGVVLRARAFPGDPLKVGLGIVPWFRAPSPPWQRPFWLQLDLLYRFHRCGCLRAAPPRCRAAGPPGWGRISRLRLLGRSGRLANCERRLRHRRQAWHGNRVRDENVRYRLADRSKWRKRPLEGRDGCLQHRVAGFSIAPKFAFLGFFFWRANERRSLPFLPLS